MPFVNRKIKKLKSTTTQLRIVAKQMRELYKEIEIVNGWCDNPRKKKWLTKSVNHSQAAVVTLLNAIEQK